jgi:hypothetical protein
LIALLAGILVFIMLWIVASLPLYMAARIVTDGRQSGAAMIVALLGVLVFFIVFLLILQISENFVSGSLSVILGMFLGSSRFLRSLQVIIQTKWPRTLLVAIMTVIMTVVI